MFERVNQKMIHHCLLALFCRLALHLTQKVPATCKARYFSLSSINSSAMLIALKSYWIRREKEMRYYLPLHEKNVQAKEHVPSRMFPLWVWLAVVAVLLLVVLAMR
jgi:hypothetical protein